MASEGQGTGRHGGIDSGRLLGAFLVILLHSLPNPALQASVPLATLLVGAAARVAVPFFFVASGLFLAIRAEPLSATARRTIGRLLPIYLFWLLFYAAVFSTPLPSYSWQWKLSILWTGGVGFQLWFLPALGASQWLVAAGLPRIGGRAMAAVAGGIAAVGLWMVYDLPPHMPFWFPRLTQGPVLVLAGHWIARSGRRIGAAPAGLLLLAAFLLSLGEDALIAQLRAAPATYQEYDLSTCLFGIAAALLARAPGVRGPVPAAWEPARLSLWLYCVHVLFLWPLLAWIGTGPPLRTAALFACVSGLSLAAWWPCRRVGWLRRVAS
jgi:hypothetical protein